MSLETTIRSLMAAACYRLGEAMAKSGQIPDTDNISEPVWQAAYQRGYDAARRRMAMQKKQEKRK